jgi:hypothetical protein
MLAPIDYVWAGAVMAPARVALWGMVGGTCALGGVALIAARRRVSAANLALVLGALALCLVTSEFALAAFGFKAQRRIVFSVPAKAPWWQFDPLEGGRFLREKYNGTWIFNAEGFPDTDDFDEAKAAGAPRRVLLLGDSFAYGASASSQSKSFAELFDHLLDASVATVVWNASLPGTAQESQFQFFERFAPLLKPQVVIATLFNNDFEENQNPAFRYYVFADGQWVVAYERAPEGDFKLLTPETAYRRAFAPQVPREYLTTLRTPSAAGALFRRIAGLDRPPAPAPYAPGATPGYRTTLEWMRKLRDAARAADTQFLVLLIPRREDLAAPTATYRDMQGICSELSLKCVEFRRELGPNDYATPPDEHWNDAGHAKAAKKLEDEIEIATR